MGFVVRMLHIEEGDGPIFTVIWPGFVATDMGAGAAKLLGMDKAPHTPEDSARDVLKVIDQATRDTHHGSCD